MRFNMENIILPLYHISVKRCKIQQMEIWFRFTWLSGVCTIATFKTNHGVICPLLEYLNFKSYETDYFYRFRFWYCMRFVICLCFLILSFRYKAASQWYYICQIRKLTLVPIDFWLDSEYFWGVIEKIFNIVRFVLVKKKYLLFRFF